MTHHTRTTVVVGRIGPEGLSDARKCSWCQDFISPSDRYLWSMGARITHGLCLDCRREYFPEDDGGSAA